MAETAEEKQAIDINVNQAPPLTIFEVENIYITLKEHVLPKNPPGLTVDIIKNMTKCERFLKKREEQIKLLQENHFMKDDNNRVIQYAYKTEYNPSGGHTNKYELDEKGRYIIIDKNIDKTTPCMPMLDGTNPEFIAALKRLQTEVPIKLIKFPKDKTDKCFEEGVFDGINLTCLIGHVIDIDMEDEDETVTDQAESK